MFNVPAPRCCFSSSVWCIKSKLHFPCACTLAKETSSCNGQPGFLSTWRSEIGHFNQEIPTSDVDTTSFSGTCPKLDLDIWLSFWEKGIHCGHQAGPKKNNKLFIPKTVTYNQ